VSSLSPSQSNYYEVDPHTLTYINTYIYLSAFGAEF